MALKINRVALELLSARSEEMVEPHFVECCGRSIRGNVAANVVLDAIRAHDHRERVPADQALDAALQFLVAREKRLQAHWNRIRVRSICAERQVDAVDRRMRAQTFENFCCDLGPAGFQDGIERLKPFLNLYVFHAMRLGGYFVVHNFGWFLFCWFPVNPEPSPADLCGD